MTEKDIKTLKDQSLKILTENRRTTDGHQYTVPSPDSYPYQWLWDSCFHAIALSHFSPEDAKKEMRALVSKQDSSGLIPHIIYWKKVPGVIDIKWGREGISSITQPPMLAYAVWNIYKKDGDKKFLEEMYTYLYHFYNYLLNERDPRHNHLVGIINPDESGEDDSPRFDIPLGLSEDQTSEENFGKRKELVEKNKTCNFDAPFCMKEFFWVKDVPFNAIFVKNLSLMGMIAEELNRMEEALYFRGRELRVADAMRDHMYEDGVFWSVMGEEYKKIYIKTWAIFSPLFAKLLSGEEAKELVERHLNDPSEFKTKYSVPTVAKEEKVYNPDGFWRGPVWVATNWFIYHGLGDYEFAEEAEQVREDTAKLLMESGFREHFNPETGAGQGAQNFTWGALIVDMFARDPNQKEWLY